MVDMFIEVFNMFMLGLAYTILMFSVLIFIIVVGSLIPPIITIFLIMPLCGGFVIKSIGK